MRILNNLTSISEQLNGHWGDYDNQDCKEAAAILGSQGVIDGDRVAIRGGSAGAYTTLSSVTFALDPQSKYPKSACGAYGCVADVTTLVKVVEKFESKYIYTLLGPEPWDNRNPIDHAEKMTRPLLVRDNFHLAIMYGTCIDESSFCRRCKVWLMELSPLK